jgi:hypothetical protein
MISREQAVALAEAHVRKHNFRISAVFTLEEIPGPRPCLYWTSPTPLEDCWFAYLEHSGNMICSSTIVVIDRVDGTVLYFGSASDEG